MKNENKIRSDDESGSRNGVVRAISEQQDFQPVPTASDEGVANPVTSDGVPQKRKHFKALVSSAARGVYTNLQTDTEQIAKELQVECFQVFEIYECIQYFQDNWANFFHIPYLPAFHKPGWMLRYILGPHTWELFNSAFSDFWAGITVAMTLIPQGLSYAQLASLPPINGLYTAILPSAAYTFFGSSMQLGVGPVAVVSLLMGELIVKYNITAGSAEAVDFAAECSLAMASILVVMSVLNLGSFIRFISHPVISGFTTAAASLIGLNQMKSAFGFTIKVPQQGQADYPYNYHVFHWFITNWNADYNGHSVRNPIATKITFGLYIPLLFFVIVKNNVKATPERKKTLWFNAYTILSSLTPLLAIIIGAHIAWQTIHDNHYTQTGYPHEFYASKLSIIGIVTPGLNFIRIPSLKWNFLTLIGDVFPLSLIAFMESYSVAYRIATQKNELHLLNASQELWAVGCANFLGSISSGYPVAGSFSRSSLNATAGARTPLSKAVTMSVVVLSLAVLTRTFQYIPNAALAAVVWVSIFNLITISDFWHAWKHSKKDFCVMLITFITVFVFDTALGLGVGILSSVLVFFIDYSFSFQNGPTLVQENKVEVSGKVKHILLRNDLNFLTAGRFANFMAALTLVDDPKPDVIDSSWNERLFYSISNTLDGALRPKLFSGCCKHELPKVIIIDFAFVRVIDITALHTIEEAARNAREKKVLVLVVNTTPVLGKMFAKFGFHNDRLGSLLDDHNNSDDNSSGSNGENTIAGSYYELAGSVIPFKDTTHQHEEGHSSSDHDGNGSIRESNSYASLTGKDEETGLMTKQQQQQARSQLLQSGGGDGGLEMSSSKKKIVGGMGSDKGEEKAM